MLPGGGWGISEGMVIFTTTLMVWPGPIEGELLQIRFQSQIVRLRYDIVGQQNTIGHLRELKKRETQVGVKIDWKERRLEVEIGLVLLYFPLFIDRANTAKGAIKCKKR